MRGSTSAVLTVMVIMLAVVLAMPARALQLEAGAVTEIWPARAVSLGGAVGVVLGTAPQAWPVVGGHLVAIDLLRIRGANGIGAATSLRPAAQDDTLRIGVGCWREDGDLQGAVYLRTSWAWRW